MLQFESLRASDRKGISRLIIDGHGINAVGEFNVRNASKRQGKRSRSSGCSVAFADDISKCRPYGSKKVLPGHRENMPAVSGRKNPSCAIFPPNNTVIHHSFVHPWSFVQFSICFPSVTIPCNIMN